MGSLVDGCCRRFIKMVLSEVLSKASETRLFFCAMFFFKKMGTKFSSFSGP